MSQISILGFAPPTPSQDPSGPGPIHWSILVSPSKDLQTTQQPQSKPKKSRFLQRWQSPAQPQQPVFESTLFDMHNHQLRQQQYPVPISHPEEESNAPTSEATTDITSSLEGKPHRLVLRIALSTHPSTSQKLATKVSTLLYATPTYGPEDDWLRAALEELIFARILDSETISYDVDAILNYARGAATNPAIGVQELDYAAHMTRTTQVKEMFSRGNAAPKSPSVSPSRNSRPANKRVSSKSHSFLGFWVTQGGSGQVKRHQEKRDYWQRQDDPYGGLM
ncbi:hypothetical protein EDD37DRAFT_480083 [Exophiala viscosa]|uniref:Uncharacterized protein n=1 Tax=Exophiala viscosa TaxID=2486360 RepID=A0AAN6DWF9_9EURO|nr:hypothetical protein EDD36DRAFT_209667 [Exophiala viscosa]KAI1622556.1 hypothetical protein EDD37DRAFT_480083 [Exophiala viscosa]